MYIHGDPKVIDQTAGITLDPYNLEDRISIYERQVFGWFIDPAAKLIELINEGAAFVVLSICFSYLEGVEQYMRGESSHFKSQDFFCSAAQRVFSGEASLTQDQLVSLYRQARCGMFHDGMTRSGVIYDTSIKRPLHVTNNGSMDIIAFNPDLCLDAARNDFKSYISKLRNQSNCNLRNNFDRMYSIT